MGFTQAFTGVLTILGTLIFMLSLNIWITLVVVLVTPLSFFVASFIARKTYTMFKLQSATRGEQTALIDEMVGNQKVVQAYGHEKEVLDKFDEINERLQKYSLQATFFSSITNPATRFVNNIVYAGVGVTGAFFALNGYLSVGMLSCFLGYANQYTKPFNEISGVVTELQNAIACAARVLELIDEEPQIPEDDDAVELTGVKGEVELSGVYFSYVEDKKLITDFNLDVKPGQRVAIVGPTGCGKTTLASIIANTTRSNFVKLNAVTSGVKEVREVIAEAENNLRLYGKETFLLLDECHRWSKAQSDSVLPALESGTIKFIGSTTENPMISMTGAIVSRCTRSAAAVSRRAWRC